MLQTSVDAKNAKSDNQTQQSQVHSNNFKINQVQHHNNNNNNKPCLKKNSQNFFQYNFFKFQPILIIFNTDMAKTIELCKVYLFPPRLIYVNALPCETQMLQIATLCGDYLYQIVHLCIINSTEGATRFNNFVVLNILW